MAEIDTLPAPARSETTTGGSPSIPGGWIRSILFGLLFWISVSTGFTALALTDFLHRGQWAPPGDVFLTYAYGYLAWTFLAPLVFRRARQAAPLAGLELARTAVKQAALVAVTLLLYCVITQYLLFGHLPLAAIGQFGVFDWLWDVILFGLVFLAGLRTGPIPAAIDIERGKQPARLAVRSPDRVEYVDIAGILAVSAQGNYAALIRDEDTILHRATMASLERRLRSAGFARIHRSHIVKIDQIQSARARGDHIREIRLRNGQALPVSERYAPALASMLHGRAC